ncbi:hypothetical protein TRIHO_19160 [Tritonibacter horizontis]|uniref:Uncharacterized protein n=1 Tax=Tritonibacter horizontis TaxID=1768241 RepID=A0A132BXR7_9RHOB|nr:hypothetical protein TRIHO_19160 [Tritonibacter horizontis]
MLPGAAPQPFFGGLLRKTGLNVTSFTVIAASDWDNGHKAVILLSIPMIVRPFGSHVSNDTWLFWFLRPLQPQQTTAAPARRPARTGDHRADMTKADPKVGIGLLVGFSGAGRAERSGYSPRFSATNRGSPARRTIRNSDLRPAS